MKKLCTLLLMSFFGITSFAQFNTGSVELDASLGEINVEAKADPKLFNTSLTQEFGVTIAKIEELRKKFTEPAEIYLSLDIAKIVKKPVDEVVKAYSANKDKGWGYIAKQMGIKPGSPEFHALKGNASKKKGKGNSASGKGGNGKGKK